MLAHGCLTDQARRRRRDIIALVTGALEGRSSDSPLMLGPSGVDRAESALWEAGYLSPQGQEWGQTIRDPADTVPPPTPPGLLRRLAMILGRR